MSENSVEITLKTKRPSAEADDIQGLLETAGHRPEVPTADLAVIKAAARVEWQRVVDSRRQQQPGLRVFAPLALAAALVLAVAIGWWWMSRAIQPAAEILATVDLLAGEIRLDSAPDQPSEKRRELSVGDALRVGDSLVTAERRGDSRSWTSLRWVRGHSVRLDSGTKVRLASGSRLELQRGAVYIDSDRPSAPAGGLEVMTPFGSVREIGTQFEVRVVEGEAEALRVRVREGEVALVRDADSHSVLVGEELILSRDGSLQRGAVERYGSAWEWVLAAAPGFDIEGATLAEFLDWVSRESGWGVDYADQELASSAATIRLHGSIEGFSPPESLGVVLPATGLGYRVESGILLVTRTPDSGPNG